jgi:mono/diheme cytochrome c family protein
VQAKASQWTEGTDAGPFAGTPQPFERIQNLLSPSILTRFDLKTSRLIIAVCSLTLSCAVTAVSAQTLPTDTGLIANPVFQKNCAKCHGKTAEGRHFAGPSLISEKTVVASADDLRNIITNGKGRMPKNAGRLTSAEIDTLVQQIKASRSKP